MIDEDTSGRDQVQDSFYILLGEYVIDFFWFMIFYAIQRLHYLT